MHTTDGAPVAQIRFADRATLWSVAADPRVSFGDAYSEGRVQIEGDLLDLLEIIYRSSAPRARYRAAHRGGV